MAIKIICKQAFLFLSLFMVQKAIIAQSPSDRQNYLPNIIPTSPEATMMQRFGNYQVNMANGLPDISIPIFEINTGKLKVPISLSYHASGIKVTDDASYVGLGWNLSAGGGISRSMRSGPDEQLNGYLVSPDPIRTPTSLNVRDNVDDLNYVNRIMRGYLDVEPDIYSCNLPTVNSKFFYKNRKIDSAVFIPYNPIKLVSTITSNNFNFNLKDESGIEYIIGNEREMTTPGNTPSAFASAWKLSQMISTDKTDTIAFDYISNGYSSGGGDYYDLITIIDNVSNVQPGFCGESANCNCQGQITTTTGGGQSSQIGSLIPGEIRFPGGKVVFELEATNRLDIANKNLKAIRVYRMESVSKAYILIKYVKFFYSYFVNGTERRLKLDSLQFRDKPDISAQTYSFTYNQAITMPLKTSRARDYWGYFNNKSNSSLIPQMVVNILGPNGGMTNYNTTIGSSILNGRDPDPAYNQVGILNKVKFPTGGYSEFSYETNQYYDLGSSQVKYAGGLRVKEIKSTDPISGVVSYKSYKYGVNESGYGEIVIPISTGFYSTEQMTYYKFDIHTPSRRIRNYCSNPNIGLEPFDGNSVGYTEVTEYNGTIASNSGKTVNIFSFRTDAFTSLMYFNKPVVQSRFFLRGQLLKKTEYKQTIPGNFQVVRSVGNSYGAFPDSTVGTLTLCAFEKNVFLYQQYDGFCTPYAAEIEPYFYNTYSIFNGDNRLKASSDTLYDQNDVSKYTVTNTTLTYGNFVHQQVTKQTTVNSKGETVDNKFKYADDSASITVYGRMVIANIKNAVLDKEVVLNGTTLSKEHTQYTEPVTNHFYPSFITSKVKTNPAITEVTFDSYDAQGNILQFTGHDGIQSAFIWDYHKKYPIAKVSGAAQANIAYTSFEGDGKGNWNFSGTPVIDPTSPTGRHKMSIVSNITKAGLAPLTYIVSYWKKSGTVTVNATSGTPGNIINGWTYFEHTIANPASGTITVAGNGAVIDELRLFPKTAQMATYSYDPLIGMTAQCDPNNRITYFEYDTYNRLMLVRDQDGRILKQNCYNYAGQLENCAVVYNQLQSGDASPQCNPGFMGTPVSYVVPANTFNAPTLTAANQLAVEFINANKQAYANAAGTCIAGATINGYNAKSVNYNVRFTNTVTGTSYPFTLNSGTSQFYNLGMVPMGTYNVQFYPQGSSVTATFVLNGLTFSGAVGTTFSNVVLTSNTSAYMY